MIFFVLIFTIFFIVLAIRRLDWALMLLFFLLPSYLIRFKFGIPLTLLEVMIWVMFLVWFFKNYKGVYQNLKCKLKIGNCKLESVHDYPFKWEMIALVIISFIAVGVAGFSIEAMGIWKAYFFEPILLYIVVFNVFWKEAFVEEKHTPASGHPSLERILGKIVYPLVLSALIISLFAVFQKFTGFFIPNSLWAAEATRRVTSVFGYPNAVGLYLEGIILLMVGFVILSATKWREKSLEGENANFKKSLTFVRNDKGKNVLMIITILLSILSIIFAKSVGASLGVGAGLIVFALLINKKVRRVTLGLLIIAVIVVSSVGSLRHTALKYLTLNDFSGQVRRAQWQETITMLRDKNHWLLGVGLDNYQNAVRPYHKPGFFVKDFNDPKAQRKLVFNAAYRTAHWQPLEIFMYPHNIILNFWSELGVFGMLLFVWIILKFFYLGFRFLRNCNLEIRNYTKAEKYFVVSLVSIMVAIIIHGLVDAPYFKNDLSVLFWLWILMMGLIDLSNRRIIS